jgi:hypothetical protein
MRKFTSNYLVTADGTFLKNGIVVATEDGSVVEFMDTKGDLREMEQLIFHSGILFSNFKFVRTDPLGENLFSPFLRELSERLEPISIQDFIELGKQFQHQFPELIIPEIYTRLTGNLETAGFSKTNLPGIFRLTGADLSGLHLKPESRLKQIL